MKGGRVLLLGSYGQTNLGDDILLSNYLEYLNKSGFSKIFINANSRSLIPKSILRAFPELIVRETYNTSMLGWIKVIREVDYVVYGGGTVYKELYKSTGRSKNSVIVRVFIFNLVCFILRRKIINLHIGVGVIKSRLSHLITKYSLKFSAFTIFRDYQSYTYALNELGLSKNKICYSTDGLFLSHSWSNARNARNDHRKSAKLVIGVNLLADIPNWVSRERYLDEATVFLKKLLEDKNNFIVFTPFQHDFNPNNDLVFIKREVIPHLSDYRNFRVIEKLEPSETKSLFKKLDILVGMRFHSLLLATTYSVPFLAIAYDTKCVRFLEESKYPYVVKIEEISSANLYNKFSSLKSRTEIIKKDLLRVKRYNSLQIKKCMAEIPW